MNQKSRFNNPIIESANYLIISASGAGANQIKKRRHPLTVQRVPCTKFLSKNKKWGFHKWLFFTLKYPHWRFLALFTYILERYKLGEMLHKHSPSQPITPKHPSNQPIKPPIIPAKPHKHTPKNSPFIPQMS